MSANMTGSNITLNGKTYKILGKEGKSFILESDGKKYKATEAKIAKIQAQNARPPVLNSSFLGRRMAFRQKGQIPKTVDEIMQVFVSLTCELSPENLACDGEASGAQIKSKLGEIHGTWKELETLLGRKVTEDQVYQYECQNEKKGSF